MSQARPANQHLTDFLSQHKDSFITHATQNDAVLKSRCIKSAEHLLREGKSVLAETALLGSRKPISLESVLPYLKTKGRLPQCARIKFGIRELNISDIIAQHYVTQEVFYHYFTTPASQLPETTLISDHITLKIINGKKVFVVDIPEVNLANEGHRSDYWGDKSYRKIMLDICDDLTKLNVSYATHLIQIANDVLSKADDRIDKRLSHVWNARYQPGKDNSKLFEELLQKRHHEIKVNSTSENIYALYNEIDWDYGDIVVLQGNTNHLISTSTLCTSLRANKPFNEYSKGEEILLLHPIENYGNFFSLEFNEDTVVIGPEEKLSQYQQANFKICYIEAMSPAQLEFLKVPDKLNPSARMASASAGFVSNSLFVLPKAIRDLSLDSNEDKNKIGVSYQNTP